MNGYHWYWLAAGIAGGFVIVCAVNWIRNEIGLRRTTAEFRERGYFRADQHSARPGMAVTQSPETTGETK